MRPLVSVIIPNYNELANVKRGVLTEVVNYLKKQSYLWEVIISDDGSTDESYALISKFALPLPQIKLIKNVHAGKPFALRSGIEAARGDFVLLTDMDQSTPINQLEKLLAFTKEGYKVVIGSRGAHRANSSFIRKYIISLGFLTFRRLIILPEIIDTQCGFKLFETKLAKQIFSRMRIFGRKNSAIGWKVTAYDVEVLHLAKKMHQKIKEVKVNWKNTDISDGKVRNFVRESVEMIFEVLRVRINDMLGKYD